MNSKRAPFLALTAVVVVGIALTACGGGGSDATAQGGGGGSETTTIRYQTTAGLISELELAKKLGYLGDLELDPVGASTSGPESIQAVATGQIDISSLAFDGAIAKAIAAGAPVKAVVGVYGSDAKNFEGLYVLDGSSIHSAKDLVGKKVGVNTLGANMEAFLILWMEKEGLSKAEIEAVEMVVIPPVNAEEALRQGQLDAAVLSGSLLEFAVANGGIRPVAKDIDVLGDYTSNSFVVNDAFIEKNPKTMATLVGGVAKAVHYLQTTPAPRVIKVAGEVAAEDGRPEDKESLKFWKSQGVANEGGVIEPQEFSIWIDWLEKQGQLKQGEVSLGDAYTNRFNPYAKQGNGGGNG